MLAQARNSFGIFFLADFHFRRRNDAFFETGGKFPPPSQSNVRESGENPERLRHCNGYKFQCHRKREGGMRLEAEARIPVWLCSSGSGRFRSHFSVKEKDEASLSNDFRQDSLDAFILRFAGA